MDALSALEPRTYARLSLLASFFVFYGCVTTAMRFVVKVPKGLTKDKEYHDYFGQHVSFCHSLFGSCLAIAVYVYESGIHYDSESNYLHDFVLAVNPT